MGLLDRVVQREPKKDDAPLTPAERRVRMVADYDLLDYAGACMNGVATSLRMIEGDPHGPGVDEAIISADVLVAVLYEMKRRNGVAI